MNITGVVTEQDSSQHTFDLSPQVYVDALKESTAPPATMPVHCYTPQNSKRWEKHPPAPRVNTYVGVSGFLHSIRRYGDGMAQCFNIELDKLTFLGRPFVPVATPQITSSPAAGSYVLLFVLLESLYAYSPFRYRKWNTSCEANAVFVLG